MPTTAPFTISRVFNAPVDLVYKVSTEPAHLMKWMGPAGVTGIKAEVDLRPGGTNHYGYRNPDGSETWGRQVYKEIVPGKKIVCIQSFSDKDGNVTRHPLAPAWPLEMLSTTTFEAAGPNQTKLTITWEPYNSDEAGVAMFDGARPGMSGGWEGTFQALENYLMSLQ